VKEGLDIVAELMKIAAVTAPKAAGHDYVEVKVTSKDERASISKEMVKIGEEKGAANWDRDAAGVTKSGAMVLIGLKDHPPIMLNCSACGFEDCEGFKKASAESDFKGPNCMLRQLDLGIALGSAVKTAQMHNVDNRIMYRAGVAAMRLNMMPSCNVIMAIPMSASHKNVYFDR